MCGVTTTLGWLISVWSATSAPRHSAGTAASARNTAVSSTSEPSAATTSRPAPPDVSHAHHAQGLAHQVEAAEARLGEVAPARALDRFDNATAERQQNREDMLRHGAVPVFRRVADGDPEPLAMIQIDVFETH